MINSFRDESLQTFYDEGKSRGIPATIYSSLCRKLDIIDAATHEADLRVPPGNKFEHLEGDMSHLCSIRVNKQYRLIFEWRDGQAIDIYLDPHTYR